jgi:hypothetical protein
VGLYWYSHNTIQPLTRSCLHQYIRLLSTPAFHIWIGVDIDGFTNITTIWYLIYGLTLFQNLILPISTVLGFLVWHVIFIRLVVHRLLTPKFPWLPSYSTSGYYIIPSTLVFSFIFHLLALVLLKITNALGIWRL